MKKRGKTTFHIVTLFPNMFDSYLGESILARGKKEGAIDFKFYNPRDFSPAGKTAKKNEKVKFPGKPYVRVDDKPYGGGPGMVMQALPVIKAIESAFKRITRRAKKPATSYKLPATIFFLTPGGKQFTTELAKKTAKKYSDIIIVCGRYEGIDERVNQVFKTEKVSVGPFVVTGGEVPAMAVIDCISRQVPGVLGDIASLEETRASSSEVYTRPDVLKYKGKNYRVPKVLLSGNHKEIEEWKRREE